MRLPSPSQVQSTCLRGLPYEEAQAGQVLATAPVDSLASTQSYCTDTIDRDGLLYPQSLRNGPVLLLEPGEAEPVDMHLGRKLGEKRR